MCNEKKNQTARGENIYTRLQHKNNIFILPAAGLDGAAILFFESALFLGKNTELYEQLVNYLTGELYGLFFLYIFSPG